MIDTLIVNGQWPASLKKPSGTELVDIYMSCSYWYLHVYKSFADIHRYPQMVAWLEHGDSKEPSDYEVWHQVKAVYNFSDLKTWIKNGGTLDLDVKKELEEEKKGQKKNKPKKAEKAKAVEAEDVEMEEVEGRKGKGKQKEKGKGKEKEQYQVPSGSKAKRSHKRK